LEGKWDEVMAYSEKFLAREPDNIVVRFVLSVAYYRKGKYDLQEKQNLWVLRDEQSRDAIVAWCEKLAQRFPQNYYAHFLIGSVYPIKDKPEKAIESYKKAIEINPNLADAYVGLGAMYIDNDEQVDEGIKCLNKAIEIDQTYVAAYLNLAAAYDYKDQTNEAIVAYEKIIEIDPQITGVYISLGELYSEKGDRDKAMKAYKKVIELEPDSELCIYAKKELERIQKD
jgi:tetratricopeptide (TPR) repeat protein